MNENKKILVVIGVIAAFVALIAFGMVQTSMSRSKMMKKFTDAYASSEEKLVYIGRPGCGACTTFHPTLEKVTKEYKIEYVDINTDSLTESQVRTIVDNLGLDWDDFGTPTIAVVKDNQVVKANIGVISENAFITFLKDSNIISE
ncbi:MAG: thioredoxin family protein [Bacilli bacterium]|jgi:predicted bacteriocin transport accessory protein|nr:thioredoxin family protein [Bacilli bacterium]